MSKYGVVIGRFQPLHDGHTNLLLWAAENCENLVIVIGSQDVARNIRNPFTFNERMNTLLQFLTDKKGCNYQIAGIPDFLNDDAKWNEQLVQTVSTSLLFEFNEIQDIQWKSITLFCHEKDQAYYESSLPFQVKTIEGSTTHLIKSTDIRNIFFSRNNPRYINGIPEVTTQFLERFQCNSHYKDLCEEHLAVRLYNHQWESAPYEIPLTTVDIVLQHGEKILVITRKNPPGKGCIALPGGFVDKYERLKDAAHRELLEETGIDITNFSKDFEHHKVFDSPLRSLRGRIITHVFSADLSSIDISFLQPHSADDASNAYWIPFHDILKSKVYSDHYEIIETMKKGC